MIHNRDVKVRQRERETDKETEIQTDRQTKRDRVEIQRETE